MSDKPPKHPFRAALDKVMGMVTEHQYQALLRSYCMAMRDERRARLRHVLELAVELDRIKKVSIFGTAFHEQCIEAIIEGDWDEVAKINGMLADPGCLEESRAEYNALWENFRAMVLAACAEAGRRQAGEGAVKPD